MANKKVNPKLKRIPTTVTIPQWLSDELSRLAIEKKVSKGDIVERALLKVIDIKQGVE